MLQVLTGAIKGRKLKVPKGRAIRPTTSRIKKSIFDTLGDLHGLRVLDIFAGSGGLGIESLSRGASHVTFIEKTPDVFKLLRDNVASCGILDKADIICDDYEHATKKLGKEGSKFDIVFIDPPYSLYEKREVLDFVSLVTNCVDYESIVIIEHERNLTGEAKGFSRVTRSFGGTKVSYFRRMS
jgi:16S rRNA (guanine966-N2)-methyltransferase